MRIAIIGGGAAGMMCAATLAEECPDVEVLLFEKNSSLGKKVIISGGGRCNVTTGFDDIRFILKKYPRGEKFLSSAMFRFPPQAVRNWFEQHGVPLVCEDDMRVFPVSSDGKDIVRAFTSLFAASNVQILCNHSVKKIEKHDEQFFITVPNKEPFVVDTVVLTLGGQAYRQTGSTGDGYTLAERLGHSITPLAASLNSFFTRETWPKELAGVSFEQATLSSFGKTRASYTGPILFTHKGVTGPAVFALSSLVAFDVYTGSQPLPITVNVVPQYSVEELYEAIQKTMHASPKKSFKNTLHSVVPLSVATICCNELTIPLEKKNAEMTKKEVTAACTWIQAMPLSVIARGAGDEFVTAGGVSLDEVNPKTMESLISPGLFFAGEILNIDGFTGGFNLQASWATGRAAGESIAMAMSF
ncbi:MAG: NAD(P)/FAD-dependent oxidoreductase [Candidatus Magasanikbacteria bacterium]|nr:NAD(P)/FAD-dependent oxidoreductase [Candidatus Magasanikbacteria bacterium]